MIKDNFTIEPLPESLKQSMIKTAVWSKGAPIGLDDLSLLTVNHYGFDDTVKEGKIVIHVKMAEKALAIFKELFILKFPIEKMKTIDNYNGDDEASMEDNNSSCFNFRNIANSKIISMHSYGVAIDINPAQNPYVILNKQKEVTDIFPKRASEYMDRANIRKGMVEPIVEIFVKHGFDEWGGSWSTLHDFHHFQIQRDSLGEL